MVLMEEKILKSTQEQAIAAWINQINQNRLDELIRSLNQQDKNLAEALSELAELKSFIGDPDHILGSPLTKHGEIAEHMQVNFSNARNLVDGLKREYTFEGVGRTAPEDYLFRGSPVQSKYYNGTKNTLGAVQKHLEKYPRFIEQGGSYDIPKDQYNDIVRVLDLAEKNPSALSKEDYRLLNSIKDFKDKTGLSLGDDVHAGLTDYSSVQQGVADKTIKTEEKNIRAKDRENRHKAYENSKPSLNEGAKAAAISGLMEGGVAFGLEIYKKRKNGKTFADFSEEDWIDIGIESGKGSIKGAIRGSAIYALTNYTATPANVASAYVTAAFGIGAQLQAYGNGEISKDDLLLNCEIVCLDATVSAISSLAGQILIPVPVLGSVIGNIVGQFVYEIGKELATGNQRILIEEYKKEISALEAKLDKEYQTLIRNINKSFERFESLEKLAFDIDVNIAFNGSISLALEVGVTQNTILKSHQEVCDFFLI